MQRPPRKNASFGAALRAGLFIVLMYVLMMVWGLLLLIPVLISRRATLWAMKRYVDITFWMLWVLCGTCCELRGALPTGPCIVAAKHQSFLDVMMLMRWLPQPRFVMKRSILYVPFLGIYAKRLGCLAIDRSRRGEAVRSLIEGMEAHADNPGQVIIFPQGTRTSPGEQRAYKGGVVKIFDRVDLPIVMAATNTGWFWPRTGIRRSPGTAVLDFFGEIPADAPVAGLLDKIELEIEATSDRLAEEAVRGFSSDPKSRSR